ncbi:MAG: TetR/AcrR family transcriptional regulator [Anaerocolumna sp.]
MKRKNITTDMMKSYIIESLFILLQEKNFDKITINEITIKAGVNRSTYYRNFNSKEDIIRVYFSDVMNGYLNEFRNAKDQSNENYMFIIFNNLYKNKERLLLIYKNKLSYLILDELNAYFEKNNDITTKGEKYKGYFHTGGIYNFMNLWFSNGMEDTPNELMKLSIEYLNMQSRPTIVETSV